MMRSIIWARDLGFPPSFLLFEGKKQVVPEDSILGWASLCCDCGNEYPKLVIQKPAEEFSDCCYVVANQIRLLQTRKQQEGEDCVDIDREFDTNIETGPLQEKVKRGYYRYKQSVARPRTRARTRV